MKPFRPEVFLFRMLAGIFIWEALLLGYSFWACAHPMTKLASSVLLSERCPRLGQRAENIFEIAIATTLSLLAGGNQLKLRSSSSDDPDGSLASRLPQLPQPPSPALFSESSLPQVQEKAPESALESERALVQESESESALDRDPNTPRNAQP